MKFLCGNCKAKYQIADEKVSGRTLRMKCRRCGHDILIDGHSMPASSPPSSPAPAAGSTRRTGTGLSSVAPSAARAGSAAQPLPPRPPAAAGLPRPTPPRSKPPSALGAEFRRHVAAPPEVPQRAPYDLWHAAINDVPVGPMTREELGRKIEAGAVTAESLCWREGMDDWRPLGELPELSQLLRRSRTEGSWSGRPPPRHRSPPHVPAPQGARASQHPVDLEESDDDYSEPTRIADLQHVPASPSVVVPVVASSGTSPKIAVAPAPIPPSVAPPEPAVVATSRQARGASGLTTGIAVGLLVGILLVGGPILYRNTYGTPAPTPSQPAPVATTQPAKQVDPATRDIQLDVPAEEEKPEPGTQPKPTKTTGAAATGKTKVEPKAEGGKQLSEEERRMLERMGGAGGAVALGGKKEGGEGVASGPSLTGPQLSKVVQENKVALQRCYETALRAVGGRQESTIKITIGITVGTSGAVKSVTTQGQGLGNMNDCMKQAVKRWRFPASGGESELEFPLVFQPGG